MVSRMAGHFASGESGGRILEGGTPTIETLDADLFGHYLWFERRTRSGRALGTVVSQHEQPLAGKPGTVELSVYFSRPLIENSLIRFVVRHRDIERQEDSQAVLVQFVAMAGSLGHALDW